MTYLNLKDKVADIIRNSDWVDNHSNEILRAANNSLEQIDAGQYREDIRGDNSQIGYDFQREIQDILFTNEVTGTITTAGTTTLTDSSATFNTTEDVAVGDFIENTTDSSVARVVSIDSATQLTTSTLRNGTNNTWSSGDSYKIQGKGYAISSTWNYKFPLDLRLAEDRDRYFEYVNPEFFKRKQGVYSSNQTMYTIEWNGNTQIIKINYDTTEALYFDFITSNMVKDSSGTRGKSFANNDDELLMPDRFSLCAVELTAADCLGQIYGWKSEEYQRFLVSGRAKMKNMIDSIGIKHNKPSKRMRIRGEWGTNRRKIREE